MSEQVSHGQILKAIDELKKEMRSDSNAMWGEINKLNHEVSTGRGALQALAWLGGFILAVGGLCAAIFHKS